MGPKQSQCSTSPGAAKSLRTELGDGSSQVLRQAHARQHREQAGDNEGSLENPASLTSGGVSVRPCPQWRQWVRTGAA